MGVCTYLHFRLQGFSLQNTPPGSSWSNPTGICIYAIQCHLIGSHCFLPSAKVHLQKSLISTRPHVLIACRQTHDHPVRVLSSHFRPHTTSSVYTAHSRATCICTRVPPLTASEAFALFLSRVPAIARHHSVSVVRAPHLSTCARVEAKHHPGSPGGSRTARHRVSLLGEP